MTDIKKNILLNIYKVEPIDVLYFDNLHLDVIELAKTKYDNSLIDEYKKTFSEKFLQNNNIYSYFKNNHLSYLSNNLHSYVLISPRYKYIDKIKNKILYTSNLDIETNIKSVIYDVLNKDNNNNVIISIYLPMKNNNSYFFSRLVDNTFKNIVENIKKDIPININLNENKNINNIILNNISHDRKEFVELIRFIYSIIHDKNKLQSLKFKKDLSDYIDELCVIYKKDKLEEYDKIIKNNFYTLTNLKKKNGKGIFVDVKKGHLLLINKEENIYSFTEVDNNTKQKFTTKVKIFKSMFKSNFSYIDIINNYKGDVIKTESDYVLVLSSSNLIRTKNKNYTFYIPKYIDVSKFKYENEFDILHTFTDTMKLQSKINIYNKNNTSMLYTNKNSKFILNNMLKNGNPFYIQAKDEYVSNYKFYSYELSSNIPDISPYDKNIHNVSLIPNTTNYIIDHIKFKLYIPEKNKCKSYPKNIKYYIDKIFEVKDKNYKTKKNTTKNKNNKHSITLKNKNKK